MRKRLLPLLLFFCLTITLACNLPRPDLTPATPTNTATPFLPTPTPTATEVPYEQCAWNWNTRPLPELSAQIQSAMNGAGLKNVIATAEAYGEDCITAEGVVDHFAAMETDFRITAQVPSLTDRESLGNLLEQILIVLDQFPASVTPGPNDGYVGVTFQTKDDELRLWFLVEEGESARALGLHGAALLDKLQNK
jgi:hypothetical protein